MQKKFLLTLIISVCSLMLLVLMYLLINGKLTLIAFINGYFMSGLFLLIVGLLLFLHCAGTWMNVYRATKKLIFVFIPLASLNNMDKAPQRKFGFWEKIILGNGLVAIVITGIISIIWF